MVWIKGIHLMASTTDELHEVASKFVISKSWFSLEPTPHYEIVIPSKLDEIARYIGKQKK